jgi:hypothetical protein
MAVAGLQQLAAQTDAASALGQTQKLAHFQHLRRFENFLSAHHA